ncbi:hypothetical protein [Streptomyces sp. Ac-502]|uniref:hypothetical protein n=1 Tax=Streptomyces sp. Ac-502 TaxID=3342801 RepID=UPI003862C92F
MLRFLTAQFLHQGAHALVLDPRRISHLWAKALPTVTHRGTIAGIHDALVHLAAELERRLDLDGDLDDVPRLIVAIDEANTTLRQLARYWESFWQKDDPKRPPDIAALVEALWAGRAARVHVIFDGRPHTAALAGMPAAHELFATVILARFTADTRWRLAPMAGPARMAGPAPKAESAPGPLPRRPAGQRPRDAGGPDDRRRRRQLAHRPGRPRQLTRRRTQHGPRGSAMTSPGPGSGCTVQ